MENKNAGFWKRSWKKITISIGVVLILVIIVGICTFLPTGMPDGEEYFKPIGERKLLPDEAGQWAYTRHLYNHLEFTGDTFAGWDTSLQLLWKYSICFTAYGMPSLALIDPERKDEVIYFMHIMIKKMKSKKVWMSWIELGHGKDPLTHQNIMFKGYLSVMYGLYQLISGDTSFSREHTWIINQIIKEIRTNHSKKKFAGAICQPNKYFVQCNAVNLLNLHIYDKLYGTSYINNEGQWVLNFIKKRMTDPETGLFWFEYHPSHDMAERRLSGYTAAMSSIFLSAIEPEFSKKIYNKYKELYVEELGPFAYSKEVKDGGPSPLATLMAFWAAKQFGDIDLFTRLRNGIDKQGGLTKAPFTDAMIYKNLKDLNKLYNSIFLTVKLHAGWQTIMDHNWGHKLPNKIPNVKGMTWKDILPQKIHEMPDLSGNFEGVEEDDN